MATVRRGAVDAYGPVECDRVVGKCPLPCSTYPLRSSIAGAQPRYRPSAQNDLPRGLRRMRTINTSYLGRMLAGAPKDIGAHLVKALGSPSGAGVIAALSP